MSVVDVRRSSSPSLLPTTPPASKGAGVEPLTKQQQDQLAALQRPDPVLVCPTEMRLAAQLAHLASQHHASEYSVVKFGQRGSPHTYIPISIQVPTHVNELRKRQACTADQDPWWLANSEHQHKPRSPKTKRARISSGNEAEQEIIIEETVTSNSVKMEGVQAALRAVDPPAEMQNGLMPPPLPSSRPTTPQPSIKTSKTHPINISPLIPAELLPIISAHLQPSDMSSATVFDLPSSMRLERLTMPPSRSSRPIIGIRPPSTPPPPVPPIFWNTSIPSSPLHAIESSLIPPVPPLPAHLLLNRLRTVLSPPPSIEDFLPAPIVMSAPPPPPPQPVPPLPQRDLPFLTPLPIPLLPVYSPGPPSPVLPSSPDIPIPPPPTPARRPSLSRFPPPILGNLLLSSCPGKKVRLTGPVKGRGAICRDLMSDLERIKGSGVGCIVCCLDDDELEFLGANWNEYSHLARTLGLDVLRVPMPEGLSPHAIAPFNYNLDTLIQNYTLRGVNVLVHCRGGVGRAGLVACCWMIKVGLCGWPSPSSSTSTPRSLESELSAATQEATDSTPSPPAQASKMAIDTPPENLNNATMELVEKAIVVIRRRRSVKAIETYEQVRFLVEFVEFLRKMGRMTTTGATGNSSKQ